MVWRLFVVAILVQLASLRFTAQRKGVIGIGRFDCFFVLLGSRLRENEA